jgi:hypothetical protein
MDGLGPIVGQTPYNPAFYGGKVAQERGLESLPLAMTSPQLAQDTPGPNFFQGGMRTYENPIQEFPGEVNVGNNVNQLWKAGASDGALPNTTVSLSFTNVVGAPIYSLNGGGWRTMLNNSGYTGVIIRSLQIATGASDSCTFVANGTGA